MRRKVYRCSDRMCGAMDCETCRPGCSAGELCGDCGVITDPDEMKEVGGVGENVCPDCYDQYEDCHRCEERFHDDDLTDRHGQKYCEVCLDEIEPMSVSEGKYWHGVDERENEREEG